MKAFLLSNQQLISELPSQSARVTVLDFFSNVEIELDDESIDITLNRKNFDYNNQAIIKIPLFFNRKGVCELEMVSENKRLRYIFELEKSLILKEDKLDSLSNFYRSTKGYINSGNGSLEWIEEGIAKGDIPLLDVLDPASESSELSLIADIEKVLPFAFNIVSNPKMHLKQESEIINIELVKKIDSHSLQHLASHSEHWKRRSLSGIIPARMKTDVFEDDMDIYENIFFRMAIEKLSKYVSDKSSEFQNAFNQRNSLINWDSYAQQMNDFARASMIMKLLPNYDFTEEEIKLENTNELIGTLGNIDRKLSNIKWSTNYLKINKTRMLELPIKPTNIINMDYNYNEVFKLWNNLDCPTFEIDDISVEQDQNENRFYQLYNGVLLGYAFQSMDYKVSQQSYIKMKDSKVDVSIHAYDDFFDIYCETIYKGLDEWIELRIVEKLRKSFELPSHLTQEIQLPDDIKCCYLSDDSLVFVSIPTDDEINKLNNIFSKKLQASKQNRKRDSYIHSNAKIVDKNHEDLKRMISNWREFLYGCVQQLKNNREYTIKIIPLSYGIGSENREVKRNSEKLFSSHLEDDVSIIYTLPFEMFSLTKVLDKNLLSRTLSYGENNSVDDVNWSNYRRGILPISQIELNSVMRFVKLIKLHTIRLGIEWDHLDNRCPVCYSSNVISEDKTTHQCYEPNCNITWGKTKCSDECSFVWVSPDTNLNSVEYREMSELELMLVKESILGNNVITDFEMDLSQKQVRFIPKCPKCSK